MSDEVVESQVQEAPQVEQNAEPEPKVDQQDDYSWVPKKFVRDGKPDFEGLTRSYLSLEKRMGSRSAASDAIEDYVFDTKHGLEYDSEVSNAFKAEAQKIGLSPEQYAWMMEKYEESVVTNGSSAEVAAGVLRKEWGRNFDSNLQSARSAWDAFAPSDMDINEVGNNPAVIKLLARIGSELSEDKPTSRNSTRSQAMSEDQINEIIRSKDYAHDPKKQEVVRAWYEANYRD